MWWEKAAAQGETRQAGERPCAGSAGMGGMLHMSGQPDSAADTGYCCCHELCLCCLT